MKNLLSDYEQLKENLPLKNPLRNAETSPLKDDSSSKKRVLLKLEERVDILELMVAKLKRIVESNEREIKALKKFSNSANSTLVNLSKMRR